MWIKKEKAYPASRAQVPFPYEGTYLVEVLVGLTAVRSLPLWDASTFLESGVVEKGKGVPCFAGTGAFSLRRYKLG